MNLRYRITQTQLLFSLFGLCIIFVTVIFFALSMNKAAMGLDFSKSAQGWSVSAVDATGLAQAQGIETGDRPVEINGRPAQIFLEQYDQAGTVWGPLIHDLTVIDDQGNSKSVVLAGNAQPIVGKIQWLMWLLVCIVFWISGYYVFFKKPKYKAAVLLLLCGLVLGLSFGATQASAQGNALALFLEIASSLVGPWLLVHFFLILPEDRTSLQGNPLIYLIYLPAVITLILFFLFGYRDGQPVLWFRTLRYFEYGAGFITVVATTIYNYVSAVSIRIKQQMKIILISSLAALVPVLVLIFLPQAIWGQGKDIIPSGFSILFVVFIPIGMGYSIVTQRLMDIDLIIRRSVVYGLITLILAALMSGAILVAVNFQNFLNTPKEIIMCLILGGLAAGLFGPTKKGIEFLVDKYLYKDRYDYRQIINSLSTSLNSVKTLSDISRRMVGTIVQTLNLAGGGLFLKSPDGFFEVSAVQGIFINNQENLQYLIAQRSGKIEFPNSAAKLDANVSYLIPLIARDKEVGLLFLAQKNSRQDFSSDDLYLIEGAAAATAMALRSAMLVRDVSTRDTFVSIASHELRTPLTSVVGYTELLLRKDPPPETRKLWLQRILSNAEKIAAMVDDLLNVTRIQSGKVTMKLEKAILSVILEERLAVAKESTNIHQFVLDIEPGLPLVRVDRDKFGEVIGNLLSNAVKYSPKGGSITIQARHDPQRRRVIVSIADHGIGIAQQDRETLFTTFHRIQRPETQSISGSGLGLFIAKEWTKAMGGDIWLTSELNKGSTFFAAVPAQEP